MTDLVFVIAAGVVGLLVGSFLNVCIYRLPKHETVLWGRSHCLTCGRQIRAWENIPVVSFLILGFLISGWRIHLCNRGIPLFLPFGGFGFKLLVRHLRIIGTCLFL